MDLPAVLFPTWLLYAAMVAAGMVLGFAASRVKWRTLDASTSNAWLGAVVVLLGLWLMRGGLKPGLSFHMLGATVLTLLMGPWLAMLSLAVLLLALAAGGHGDWLALGLDWLCDAAVPVAVTAGLLQLARHKLPAQLFVYVFINAFIAGGLSLFCSALAGMLLLGSQAVYAWDYLLEEALPFYFLLSWSEAFTTGLTMAVLVVYRPHWVSTFDDAAYLGRDSRW
ncbi:energy-coupling factor ABC transporter permease [Aquitalea pelogenes]|uniref:energy-coupling factor ABC transporter permease n=1 Tax=Aquitalea pelogenes TaxID=1293573 RepID=UPI0007878FB7|nr:energy-coupling factor ABC transporter permease [Aquitalea pelogenes]